MYRVCITPLTPDSGHCYRNNGRNQVVFPEEKPAKNPPGIIGHTCTIVGVRAIVIKLYFVTVNIGHFLPLI